MWLRPRPGPGSSSLPAQAVDEVLAGAGAPLELREGCLAAVTITVPWAELGSRPCHLHVTGLRLALSPREWALSPPAPGSLVTSLRTLSHTPAFLSPPWDLLSLPSGPCHPSPGPPVTRLRGPLSPLSGPCCPLSPLLGPCHTPGICCHFSQDLVSPRGPCHPPAESIRCHFPPQGFLSLTAQGPFSPPQGLVTATHPHPPPRGPLVT